MNELLREAVEKLIIDDRYVQDALALTADQFQDMSDGGNDSLYAAPARRWRHLVHDVKQIREDPSLSPQDQLDDSDVEMIAAGILWYELNTSY